MKRTQFLSNLVQIGAGFFTNLAAGYFFALYATTNVWVLINDVIACIVCLVFANYLANMLNDE